jgi:hypothetical protein
MNTPSPDRIGSPMSVPSGAAIAVKQPPEIAPMLAPALVVSGHDLAAPLNQRAVGVEEKLGIVESSTVSFVDADGHDDSRLLLRVADGIGSRRWYRYRLIEQLEVLTSGNDLVARLDERKVRVLGHHGFWKRGKLHSLLPEFLDLAHDLVDRSLAAIEDGTQLDCRGSYNS